MIDKNFSNNKIFFILSLGIILLSLLGVISNDISQRSTIQNNAEQYILKFTEDFNKNLENEVNSLHSFLSLIDNENLYKSYLFSNRNELYSLTKPILENLNKYNNITHFYFIKPNDEVFLRVHDFKKHSDVINRFTYLKAKESEKDYFGLELGINNTFTLRYVHPWIVNNQLIGYIELGKEIDKITKSLSEKMDIEILFVINKKEINNSSLTDKNYVVYKTSNINQALSDFIESENTTQTLTFNDKNYIAFKSPLKDISNKDLGSKIILVNLTNEYKELNKQSFNYGLIMGIATLLMLCIGYLFSKFKQKQINFAINKLDLSKNKIELLLNEQNDLLELFNIGDSILFKWNNNKEHSVSYVSNNVKNLLGYSKDDFLSQKIKYSACIFPEDLEIIMENLLIESSKEKGFFKHLPYRIINKKGEIRWVLDYTIFSKDLNGNLTHYLSYIIDITEQKMVHESLKKLIDYQNNIIILTNGKELNYANKQFFSFFKYVNLEDFKKEHNCICEFFIEDDRYFHLKKIDENQNWIEEIQKIPENKSIVAMKDKYSIINIFSVHINNFEKDLCIISFTNISETMNHQQTLEKKVNFDKLTNTYNREYFDNNIENILINNNSNNLETAIVIFDIDYFKKVNDTFGHDVGDEVLKDFVNIIKSNSRFSEDILIRWGGEEFLMILSVKDKNTILNILEKYKEAVSNNDFHLVGKVTCSIGASVHTNSLKIENTIKQADIALYEAKNSGRNKVVLI